MSFETACKCLNYIFNDPIISSSEKVTWDFIGGEPLLEIDLIDSIVEYAIALAKKLNHKWENNFEIRITTNGLLYSTPKVQDFIKKYHSHLSISISIDGDEAKTNASRVFKDGTGSYSRVIKEIKQWRLQFPHEGTKMTISHQDLPYVFESIKHLISLNILNIDVNPVLENVWQIGDEVLFEKELIKCADYIIDNDLTDKVNLSCFRESLGVALPKNSPIPYGVCGDFALSIDYEGNFFPCLRFAKFSLRNKTQRSIGNMHKGINWNHLRPLQSYCNSITSEACKNCEISNGCKSCPAENYDSSDTNTIFQQQLSSCKMHQAKIRAKNYYFNKLERQYIID